MSEPENEQFLDDFNYVLSIFIFLSSFISVAYVLVSVRFNLDISAYVVLAAYLISFLLSIPFVSEEEKDINLGAVFSIAAKCIYGSLYYFTFEMKKLEVRLRAETYELAVKEH